MRINKLTAVTVLLLITIMAFNVMPASAARIQLVWDDGSFEYSTAFPPIMVRAAVRFDPQDTHPTSKTGEYIIVVLWFYLMKTPQLPKEFKVRIYNANRQEIITPFIVQISTKFTAPDWLKVKLDRTQRITVTGSFYVSMESLPGTFYNVELGHDTNSTNTAHSYLIIWHPNENYWGWHITWDLGIRATVRYPGPP